MDIAKEVLKRESPPFVVTANHQTAGRGRGNNIWQNVKEGFYGTFVLRTSGEKIAEGFSVYLGFKVLRALGLEKGQACLKWPNDLISKQSKKFGGILIEMHNQQSYAGEMAFFALIGIGLNIAVEQGENPEFASLKEFGIALSREDLLETLKNVVLDSFDEFSKDHFRLPTEEILPILAFRDQWIKIAERPEKMRLKGLTEDGRLVCATTDNRIIELLTATSLRPCDSET